MYYIIYILLHISIYMFYKIYYIIYIILYINVYVLYNIICIRSISFLSYKWMRMYPPMLLKGKTSPLHKGGDKKTQPGFYCTT
jgi:hypothetical protein